MGSEYTVAVGAPGARRPALLVARTLLALVVIAAALVALPADSAASTTSRLYGPDRYATSAAVSEASFYSEVPVAFVATGENYPDALAGGPAAARAGGPVLLTAGAAVPTPTREELRRLRPAQIVVLGGGGAISPAVEAELRDYAPLVRRIAGRDRFETAARLSAEFFDPGVPAVYVATGGNYPDALAAGPAAGHLGAPILLVAGHEVPSATRQELARLQPEKVVLLGGTSVISPHIESELAAFGPTERQSGSDRFATAVAVSQGAFRSTVSGGTFVPAASKVFLAYGGNFPDALSGGPVAALAPGPILLVHPECIPGEVVAEIDRLDPQEVVILGGPSVIGAGVEAGTPCGPVPVPEPGDGPAPGPPPPLPDGAHQFRVIYALPSDRPAVDGRIQAIRHEMGLVLDWFSTDTGGQRPRLVRQDDGHIDVPTITLSASSATLDDPHEWDAMLAELRERGIRDESTSVVAYVEASGNACGLEADGVAILWLRSPCDIKPSTDTPIFPYGASYLAAHEMTHAFGAVPACAPNHDGTGHVSDSNRDLLYQGPGGRDWDNLTLDVNNDDYFRHGRSDCLDIADSPLWEDDWER